MPQSPTKAAAKLVLQRTASATSLGSPGQARRKSNPAVRSAKPVAGSLYGLCNFDKSQVAARKKDKGSIAVPEDAVPSTDTSPMPPPPAPLDNLVALMPVLHCLGPPPEGGVPAWAALTGISRTLHDALRGACRESPQLLHEWRALQGEPREASRKLALAEDFLSTWNWTRHDLKGKTHGLEPTILHPRSCRHATAYHVLALSPVSPPEEFVLDMGRHRRISLVEFSWSGDRCSSAQLQLCKYLKQTQAPPVAVASLVAAAEDQSGVDSGWRCLQLELDWARRVYHCCPNLDASSGSLACAGPASSVDIVPSGDLREESFRHEVCDGVRYLKFTELQGSMAFALLKIFE
mmetsp:Transcript_79637/g.234222  ORF Transcript_79637/g.234222 Transcript_79637/m.234222 type:complete len:349 (+) Transcript_79637:58-1104(+)